MLGRPRDTEEFDPVAVDRARWKREGRREALQEALRLIGARRHVGREEPFYAGENDGIDEAMSVVRAMLEQTMTRLERFLAAWLVYLLIVWQARNHYYPTASVGAITVAVGCGALVAWWWSKKECQ